jgi:hypothetical protein
LFPALPLEKDLADPTDALGLIDMASPEEIGEALLAAPPVGVFRSQRDQFTNGGSLTLGHEVIDRLGQERGIDRVLTKKPRRLPRPW